MQALVPKAAPLAAGLTAAALQGEPCAASPTSRRLAPHPPRLQLQHAGPALPAACPSKRRTLSDCIACLASPQAVNALSDVAEPLLVLVSDRDAHGPALEEARDQEVVGHGNAQQHHHLQRGVPHGAGVVGLLQGGWGGGAAKGQKNGGGGVCFTKHVCSELVRMR